MGLTFRRSGGQLPLGSGFGSAAQPLSQPLQSRAPDGRSPLGCHRGRFFIRAGGGQSESQLVFPRQAELLVRGQPPVFTGRTTPVSVGGVLAVEDFQFNDPDGGAQLPWAQAPMDQLLAAEGEKPRPDAGLLLAAVAGVAGESTRGLRLALPSRSHARFVDALGPSSSCSFAWGCRSRLYSSNRLTFIMGAVSNCAPRTLASVIGFDSVCLVSVASRA